MFDQTTEIKCTRSEYAVSKLCVKT